MGIALWGILYKSWKQHPTKHQLYNHLPPISKTIQIRWTRYAGHCWRSKVEHVSDISLWISSHRYASVGWPTRTYLQQLCTDTGYRLENLPEMMDDQDEWWERVREIHASSTIWWWIINQDSCFICIPVSLSIYLSIYPTLFLSLSPSW